MSQIKRKGGGRHGVNSVSARHSQEEESIHDPLNRSVIVDEKVTFDQIVKINDRGVIVIPKEILEKMDIGRGRDLLLLSMTRDGEAPMIILLPSDHITGDIKIKLNDMKVD